MVNKKTAVLKDLETYLAGQPDPGELDVRGCFSKATNDEIDEILLSGLTQLMEGFELPEDHWRGTDPNNKWRAVSCMQKAIRFGDAETAMQVACAAYDMDKAYLLRRLGICAIEDTGYGNMYGVAMVLAVLGDQHWRKEMGERRVCAYLAGMLAKSPKDRSACELLVIVDFDKQVPKEAWGKLSNEELVQYATDGSLPIIERQAAIWLLAGTKRFWGESMPKDNDREPKRLFQLLIERGCSRLICYVASKVASRLHEGMWVSLLMMHEWMQQGPAYDVLEQPVSLEKVGKLLGAGYDMHTREGKAAIRKFYNECSALHKFGKQVEAKQINLLMNFGTFVAEGGVLGRKSLYGTAEAGSGWLSKTADRIILSYPGLPEAMHEEFVATIRQNLTQLNECRRKVLWSSLKEG